MVDPLHANSKLRHGVPKPLDSQQYFMNNINYVACNCEYVCKHTTRGNCTYKTRRHTIHMTKYTVQLQITISPNG